MPAYGTFCWNELLTNDPDRAKAFYGEVLGWTFTAVDLEDTSQPAKPGGKAYILCRTGDQTAGGMLKLEGPQLAGIAPQWVSYIKVANVDAVVAKVAGAGGRVKMAPFDVPSVGRIAVISDPSGAPFCVMTPVPR